jgi:hypothetical protein
MPPPPSELPSEPPPEMASSPSPEPRRDRPVLPSFLRAAIGIVATVVDDRHSLPDRALELPVLAVSTALQMSLRAQQRYAALTARGDEFLNSLRGVPDEPPAWARFDDDQFDGGQFDDGRLERPISRFSEQSALFEPESPADQQPITPPSTVLPTTVPTNPEPPERPLKAVNKPRKRKPSAFDSVLDTGPDTGTDAGPDSEGSPIPHPTEG